MNDITRTEEIEVPRVDGRRAGRREETRGGVGPWWVRTTAIALGLALGVVLLGTAWLLARAIALLILGIVIGEALAPVVDWLERRMPRLVAILLTYLTLALTLAGIGFAILPILISQAQQVLEQIPILIAWAQQWLERFPGFTANDILGVVTTWLGEISGALVALPVAIVTSLAEILLIAFISIYWLLQAKGRKNFTLSLFPKESQDRAYTVAKGMSQAMGGFVRATVIDGAIVAVLSYLGLTIIGVEFALALALFAGVMEFIPVVGPTVAAIPMIAVALTNSFTQALIVLAFVLALQQFESNVLMPSVMRSQTRMSPLLALLALFVGSTLGGLLGALVAIPLVAGLRVFVLQIIAPGIRSWTGAEPVEES